MKLRIVRPAGATGTLPVVLYIHGAGWVFGNAHTHDRLIREMAAPARPWSSRTTTAPPRRATRSRSS